MSTPRDVLVAYSNQKATTEQVWRALMAHNGWYVPAAFALRNLHTNFSEGMTIFANEIPTADSALILFTDPVAAGHADGAPIGPFMREFAGVRIFQALDNGYGCVRVNPHSSKSEGWYISQEAFPFAKLWATVTDLELALAASPGGTFPHAKLAVHPGLMILINAERLPITLNLPQGSYAVAFTAPDGFQSFVATQPENRRANLKSAALDGVSLCKTLQSFEVAGVAIYDADGRYALLPKEEFDAVIQAAPPA